MTKGIPRSILVNFDYENLKKELQKGADPNVFLKDKKDKESPLHFLLNHFNEIHEHKAIRCLELLLQSDKIDPNKEYFNYDRYYHPIWLALGRIAKHVYVDDSDRDVYYFDKSNQINQTKKINLLLSHPRTVIDLHTKIRPIFDYSEFFIPMSLIEFANSKEVEFVGQGIGKDRMNALLFYEGHIVNPPEPHSETRHIENYLLDENVAKEIISYLDTGVRTKKIGGKKSRKTNKKQRKTRKQY